MGKWLGIISAVMIATLSGTNVVQADETNTTQAIVDRAVAQVLKEFAPKKLETNEFAVTLIDWTDREHPTQGNFRGEVQIYPASVVKIFYMVAAFQQLQEGKLQDTAEFRRAMRDMIVDSYNEPTGYIVDLLTGTTSGPELPEAEMKVWWEKRNEVNRYFTGLGYTNINVSKKPWSEGPYGREKLAAEMFKPSRNWLTTDATARLLSDIMNGKVVSPTACEQMKELLRRDFSKANHNYQAHDFTARALPAGAKLWSKAGWNNDSHHDAAYVELPNGVHFTLVTFTDGHAGDKEIIPAIAREVMAELSAKHAVAH